MERWRLVFENRVLRIETHCMMQHEEELGVQESKT